MPVIMGLATVPSSSTAAVFTLPAGLCNFTVFQPTPATAAVYLGTSPGVAATNGMPIPVTPLQEETFVAGRGVAYYATTGSATASSFCYLISTAA